MTSKKRSYKLLTSEKKTINAYIKDHITTECNVIYVSKSLPIPVNTKESKSDNPYDIIISGMKYSPCTASDKVAIIIPTTQQPTPVLLKNFRKQDWRSVYKPINCFADIGVKKMTDSGLYSVSNFEHANAVAGLLINYYPDLEILTSKVLTDVTAGVGGNTIGFARVVRVVNAIEIEHINAEILSDSLTELGIDNVNVYHGNFLEKIKDLQQDIIFIHPIDDTPVIKLTKELGFHDPELVKRAGGLNKNTFKTLSTLLRGKLANAAQVVIMKLPTTYNFDSFYNMKSYPYVRIVNILSLSNNNLYKICIVSKFPPHNELRDISTDRQNNSLMLYGSLESDIKQYYMDKISPKKNDERKDTSDQKRKDTSD